MITDQLEVTMLAEASYEEIDRTNLAYQANVLKGLDSLEAGLTVPLTDLTVFLAELRCKRMLDAGCGWGRYVHRFIEGAVEYTGIDHCPEMLEEARKRNPSEDFRLLSYHDLVKEFGEEAFDGIWACCVFGGLPKARAHEALVQMCWSLKPNGTALFILPLSFVSEEGMCDTEHGPMFYSSWDIDEFTAALKRAGFSSVEANMRFQSGSSSFLAKK